VGFYNDQTSDGQSLEGKAASRSLDSKGEIVRRGACRTGAGDSLFKGVAVVRGKWEGGGPAQRHAKRERGARPVTMGRRVWAATAIPHEAGELKGGGDADKWTRRQQCGYAQVK
jgi:hypothetical protein